MGLEILPAFAFPREVRALFSAYTDMLTENDPSFAKYLALQNYDDEIAHPEKKYSPPWGRLYLARCEGQTAGCIGLRRLDEENCEMKRLYVRPEFRGRQIGDRLVRRIIADAREIGYSHMLLDTLPFLESALRMYKRFGFYEIPCYNNSPMESSIYMKLDL